MNNRIKTLPHAPVEPLRIERDFTFGNEIIVIEGVRYDAEYFRTFAYPETDVLYAVRRDDDNVVLTTIRNMDDAAEFFNEEKSFDYETGERRLFTADE